MFAQNGDVRGQIALFHEGTRPHGNHQVIFGDHLPALFDQNDEQFQDLGSQRNDLAAAEKNPILRIEAKVAEFVNGICLLYGWPLGILLP